MRLHARSAVPPRHRRTRIRHPAQPRWPLQGMLSRQATIRQRRCLQGKHRFLPAGRTGSGKRPCHRAATPAGLAGTTAPGCAASAIPQTNLAPGRKQPEVVVPNTAGRQGRNGRLALHGLARNRGAPPELPRLAAGTTRRARAPAAHPGAGPLARTLPDSQSGRHRRAGAPLHAATALRPRNLQKKTDPAPAGPAIDRRR